MLHKRHLYSLLVLLLFPLMGSSQDFSITGTVIDKESKEPLLGAVVYIHESGQHSVCNAKGEFKLEHLKAGKYHVHASMLSYEPFARDIEVNGNITTVIEMEPTSIELKNFTLESDRIKSEAVKSSQNIESADKDFIEKQGGNTFSQALEKIPGMNSLNVGVGIAKPVIRGMSSNRVMVTENGVKQEGQQWGADHGLELDQFNVERVEILKGPSSLLYGSDAIGGVINILPPAIPLQGKINTGLSSFYRSNNNAIGTSWLGEGNLKGNFFRVRFTVSEFGDYKVPADSFIYNTYTLPIYNHQLKNTAGNEFNYSIGGGMIHKWGMFRINYSRFSQHAGLFPGATGKPRAYNLTDDGNSRNIDIPRQINFHDKLLVNLNIQTKKGWIENDFGYQINQRTEEANPHAHGYFPLEQFGNTALYLKLNTISLNSRWHTTLNEKWKSVAGISMQHLVNQGDGFEFLIPDYTSFGAGIYEFLEYRKNESTTLNFGARTDYSRMDLNGFDAPVYNADLDTIGYTHRSPKMVRDFFNWSAATGISLEPSHEWNIKLNLGRSFRYPNAAELAGNGIHHGTFRHEMGDSTLNSEIGYQLDLGFIHHDKNYILKLTPFYNYFSNYIYLRPSGLFSPLPDAGQIYQYTQASVIYTGAEFYAEYHLVKELHIEFSAEYVFTYNIDNGLSLPFTPPGSVFLSPEYRRELKKHKNISWFASLEGKYFLAQNRTDRNENSTPGYFLIGASAGFEMEFKKWKCELFVRGNNLTNEYYLNHLSRYRILNLPEQGRNFSIVLRIPLEISTVKE